MSSKIMKLISSSVYACFCVTILATVDVTADESGIVDHRTLTKDLIIEPAPQTGSASQNAANYNGGATRSLNSGSVSPAATRQFVPVQSGQRNPGSGRAALKVEFEYNSADLTTQARSQLDQLAMALNSKSLQNYGFKLIGHTDSTGSDLYNLGLSERRAYAVVSYLHNVHQMPSRRLHPEGRGERELAIPSQPRSHANRRVEVINMGKQ